MPIGIIINSLCVLAGGIIGSILKNHLSEALKETMLKIFAFAAITLGITSIMHVESTTIVISAFIFGTIIGELLKIDDWIKRIIQKLLSKYSRKKDTNNDLIVYEIVIAITIFCFSGTGIFGALLEGMNGDSSILITKSILDLFTAIIFATSIGMAVSLISIPQMFIYLSLFFLAGLIQPIMVGDMMENFIAMGGIIILVLGFQLLDIIKIKVVNVIPSLLLVILITYISHLL